MGDWELWVLIVGGLIIGGMILFYRRNPKRHIQPKAFVRNDDDVVAEQEADAAEHLWPDPEDDPT